jgi:DNA modification methylase
MAHGTFTAEEIERWPLARLVEAERNPRTHSAEQIDQIAASMREFGWTIPVLVDEGGVLIAGHGRLRAAQQLGLTDAPVIIARGWTEAQKRAYRIADNKLAENAGWDDALLAAELGELRDMDFDLALTGFSMDELDSLFALDAPAGMTDENEVPALPAQPVSAAGDVWQLGAHRLVCGDATDAQVVAAALAGVTPHLMVTDPPYGVEYDAKWRDEYDGTFGKPGTRPKMGKMVRHALGKVQNDDRADWREAWALFPGDIAYVWHGGLHAAIVQASLEASGFAVRAQIIWAKQHFVFSRGDYHWMHEPCWYAVRTGRTGHWAGDRTQTTVWDIPNHNPMGGTTDDVTSGHGTQKPVECMKRPIENNSSRGQTVYDPFVGSGTTIIAAEVTGRACHAIELNPAYVDVAVLRWQNFTGGQATLEADGSSFEAVRAARLMAA